ncbi:MAG TPA: bacillithiol transferase BstA [Terriglobales bacterium]
MSASATVPDLSYPIGKFVYPAPLTRQQRVAAIDTIEQVPSRLREAVRGLSPKQLDTPYRPGGWTVRQVVHHVPDSHMNALIRTKLALTEDEPTIKPYDEKRWAELADTKLTAIETSLVLLEAVHERWNHLLRAMSDSDFNRTFRHPEHGARTVDWMLALYAWHGPHHVAHVTSLRERNGWQAAMQRLGDEGIG